MSVKEGLIKARAKVEEGWCQGAAARDKGGLAVAATSSDATRFCILGAINAARLDNGVSVIGELYCALKCEAGESSLAGFNDAPGRTQEEVLALFDKAIARVEESNGNS